jgi:hypothetical protein
VDKSRRYQFLAIIRSIPGHLVSKQSWRRLRSDPLRCFLCVVGPFLYTFAQRKTRNDKTALQTTLNRLIDLIGVRDDIIPARLWPIEPELSKFKNLEEINNLGSLFTDQGSDKNIHGYTEIYQIIFASIFSQRLPTIPTIVEIGIGSRNPAIPSNMGVFGTPGASLRAFKAFVNQANIVGGDVDSSALFQEDRIKTFLVDQLDLKSLNEFLIKSGEFDLFIDDGLHEIDANLNTLTAALAHSKPGSWIVIEDIDSEKSTIWLTVANLLSKQYKCWLVQANRSLLFVVHRKF